MLQTFSFFSDWLVIVVIVILVIVILVIVIFLFVLIFPSIAVGKLLFFIAKAIAVARRIFLLHASPSISQ